MKPFNEVCPHKLKHETPEGCQETLLQELREIRDKIVRLDLAQDMIRDKFYEVERYRPDYAS